MGQNRKVTNYPELEKLYITEGKTYQQLADMAGVTLGAVGQYAKRNDWRGKRIAYEHALARQTYNAVSAEIAHERATIKAEAITVVRASLRQYAHDVVSGKTTVTAKDAAILIELLVNDLMPEENKESDDHTIVVNGTSDTDFIRGVVEAARGRLPTTVSVGGDLLERSSDSRPN
jgi:hypothetical protein